jgi:hypothetical protein
MLKEKTQANERIVARKDRGVAEIGENLRKNGEAGRWCSLMTLSYLAACSEDGRSQVE